MAGALVMRRMLLPLRLFPASRPQRYSCAYEVTLTNHANHPVPLTVVCPLPPDLPYQRVSSVAILAPTHQVAAEETFHNRYVSVHVVVPGQGSVWCGLRADITVVPRFSPVRYEGVMEHAPVLPYPAESPMAVTPAVMALADRVVGSLGDEKKILKRCYEYVVSHLTYGDPIPGLYSARDALQLPRVDCGGFSTLLGALLAAKQIRSRLVVGFETGFPNGPMHAWLEARLTDGRFLVMDPSVDYLRRRGRTRRLGGFGFVGSDRVVFSVGTNFSLRVGRQTVFAPILQHPIVVSGQSQDIEVQLHVSSKRL